MIFNTFDPLDWVFEHGSDIRTPVACSNCGMTLHEYKHLGKLGCSSCYQAFGTSIEEQLAYCQKSRKYSDRKLACSSSWLPPKYKEGLVYQYGEKNPSPWYLNHASSLQPVVSTRIRLARNLTSHSFPHYLNKQNSAKLYAYLANNFMNMFKSAKEEFLSFAMADIDKYTRATLVEKRLISPDFAKQNNFAYLLMRKDERVSIMLGEEDHIRIQVMAGSSALYEAYAEAEKIALLFEEKFGIAFSQERGFLTSCVSNTGSGMRASLMVHLPFLAKSRDFKLLCKSLNKIGFTIRGDHGEHSQAEGDLFQISNQLTLGIDIESTLKQLEIIVAEIIKRELNLEKKYLENSKLEVVDKLARSFATLKNAYLLSYSECINLASDIRTAIRLNYIKDNEKSRNALNILTYLLGSASLQKEKGMELEAQDRDYLRASIVRELMQDIDFSFTNDF